MQIVSRVCAEFHDAEGNVLFSVYPHMRGQMTEAPESIRQDLLFQMLVNDGSLVAVENVAEKKILEQDPMAGVDAEGKSAADAAIAKAKAAEKSATASGRKKAKDPADGTQLTMDQVVSEQ